MAKRIWLLLVALLVTSGALPVTAQESAVSAGDLVPADFAGFIQVRLDNPRETLQGLNIALYGAALLAPERSNGGSAVGFDDFVPLATLFDVEGTSFSANVLPWAAGGFALAYRDFGADLGTTGSDVLAIIPVRDLLAAASGMSPVIRKQDLLRRLNYRGVEVYQGDKGAIALTSQAVLIGAPDLVKQALDVQAGEASRLVDDPVYQAVRVQAPADPLVWAYAGGDHVMRAINGVLNGQSDSQPLLQTLGGALEGLRGQASFESLLLAGGFDGAGVSVERKAGSLDATLVFHSAQMTEPSAGGGETKAMTFVPRNALLVNRGTDLSAALTGGLGAASMSNFARQILGGLSIQTVGTASEAVAAPSTADVVGAVEGFIDALRTYGSVDVRSELLDRVKGPYALALLPRPNNPVPGLNLPFDLVLAAEVQDGTAASTGIGEGLTALFGLTATGEQTVEDWTFSGWGATAGGEPIFLVGSRENMLLVVTAEAATAALDAERGDNRMLDGDGWKILSESGQPDLYVDAALFYNTFFPVPGGLTASEQSRARLGARVETAGDRLYRLTIRLTLPDGLRSA